MLKIKNRVYQGMQFFYIVMTFERESVGARVSLRILAVITRLSMERLVNISNIVNH